MGDGEGNEISGEVLTECLIVPVCGALILCVPNMYGALPDLARHLPLSPMEMGTFKGHLAALVLGHPSEMQVLI